MSKWHAGPCQFRLHDGISGRWEIDDVLVCFIGFCTEAMSRDEFMSRVANVIADKNECPGPDEE